MIRFKKDDGSSYPDWKEKSLEKVCDYVDYRGKTPQKTDNGIFLITAKNIRQGYIDYETSKEYISEEDYEGVMHRGLPKIGDVLITTEAPCGFIAQIDKEKIALAQRVIKYRGKETILNNTYLKYVLSAKKFQNLLASKATGGTVKGIKGSTLHKLKIDIPCLEEQQKIADFLSSIDDIISASEKEVINIEEQKKGVMQKIFGREVRFKADDGSDFPEWETAKLEKYADVYDGTHQTPKYVESGIKFVSVEDIGDLYSTNKFITEEAYKKDFNIIPERNDILMTRIGNVGTPALVTSDEEIAFYVSLALLKCKGIRSEYLYHYIKSEPFQNELWKRMLHIAFPMKINKGDIGQCIIQVPCLEEQLKIADFLSDFDIAIKKAKTELECWKEIKKGLLQQLFM